MCCALLLFSMYTLYTKNLDVQVVFVQQSVIQSYGDGDGARAYAHTYNSGAFAPTLASGWLILINSAICIALLFLLNVLQLFLQVQLQLLQ